MGDEVSLWLFVVSAFTSATFFPGTADLLFLHLLDRGHSPWLLIVSGTLSSTVGAFVMYAIGWMGTRWAHRQWEKWRMRYPVFFQRVRRWGSVAGLLSPLPIVGDGIPLVLGLFRVSPVWSVLFLAAGKCLRFLVLWVVGEPLLMWFRLA